ncbi:hypothetical protein [Methylacidimicrobium sp. B4]|uniref:hypothetical protein n=1 Tax=Methylacidimicrobium sp. B4 TaxID=2796139 RepID=UPI001A903275|nr:hypothetical protein [Methylacidimicrobium sp. B4]QSR85366.1 hypothetical protein MacB4_03735 [Methylacidimicrobium sp. B4]
MDLERPAPGNRIGKRRRGRFQPAIPGLLLVLLCWPAAGRAWTEPPKSARGLHERAVRVFGPLTPAETALLSAVPAGLPARIGSTVPPWLPRNPQSLPPGELRRTIRAEIIRWLLLNRTARGFLTQRGIEIDGARIWGPVYLSYLRIAVPLRLRHCFLHYPVDILHLTIPALSFAGCAGSAIYGERLVVSGDVDLRGLQASEEVRLGGLRVGGNFDASQARFTYRRPCALFLEDGRIDGSLSLRDSSFLQTGAILRRLRVRGSADLREIHRGPESKFDLRQMRVGGRFLGSQFLRRD